MRIRTYVQDQPYISVQRASDFESALRMLQGSSRPFLKCKSMVGMGFAVGMVSPPLKWLRM